MKIGGIKISHWFWGGIFLLKLGWMFKYNRSSPYARLRFEIAYGDPKPKITWTMIKEVVRYGYWAHRMKKDSQAGL